MGKKKSKNRVSRRDTILAPVNRTGRGLEIGPSHNPVAPKAEGFNVEIIDHLSQAGLREKYKDDTTVNIDAIEPVDYVWQGESYRELLGPDKYYDWIIASHVIEHVPDLAGFINECSGLLAPGGVLSLAVPDARYCFDQFRPISGLSTVLDTHLAKHNRHSVGSVAEFALYMSMRGDKASWNKSFQGENRLFNSESDAVQRYHFSVETDEYIDIHKWCFTPSSFRLIMRDLNLLGVIDLKECHFQESFGSEFFVALRKMDGESTAPGRLELCESVRRELAEPMFPRKKKRRGLRRWFRRAS